MSFQHVFAAALLDPAATCPDGLATWNGSDPARRFAVYRNNVTSSLVDAVGETFPVVRQLVGDAFFRAMAAEFVRAAPPASRILAQYGAGFPAFLSAFEPARALAYLPDMARLEWLRVQAYHAADGAPLAPEHIAHALSVPERLPAARVTLHPSVATLASTYGVVSLWAAHHGIGELGTVDPYRAENALVVRHALDVEVVSIDAGAAGFVASLARGEAFGAAAAAACDAHPAFDLAATLAILIRAGAITGLTLPGS
jgi:hypothetical protein